MEELEIHVSDLRPSIVVARTRCLVLEDAGNMVLCVELRESPPSSEHLSFVRVVTRPRMLAYDLLFRAN
jgi:hypothetical protein